MKIKDFEILILGFAIGSITMAYIADYNRDQLPLAILFLCNAILFRSLSNKKL